ncbi:MAG: hypothetical protein FWF30_04345, partial [Coriobacteriia bacterium]|nr:hypothetical protein [Coriobacteriia bacterium]
MPIGPARMPLFDHLGELRRRLTIIVAAVLVVTVGLYLVSDTLVYILVRPIIQFVTTPEIAAQVKGAADLSTYHILNV